MAVEDVEKFYSEVLQNNQQLTERLQGLESNESFYQTTAQLGQENGYTFTPGDVETYVRQKKSEMGELSDQELEAVAGGIKIGPIEYSEERCPMDTRVTSCFGISCCVNSVC